MIHVKILRHSVKPGAGLERGTRGVVKPQLNGFEQPGVTWTMHQHYHPCSSTDSDSILPSLTIH